MKALVLTLTVYAMFLMGLPVNAYCEDSTSSGVIVIGPSEKSTAQTTSSGTNVSAVDPLKSNQPGDSSNIKITGPELNASFRVMYDIKGSRIGDVQVSDAVELPAEGMITTIDPGMGKAFTIVRVDAEGKETLALSISPEHAVGQKLTKGKYKIYPLDPDRKFVNEKLTAKVQVCLVGNEVMDPRGRGELYKSEKDK